MIENGCSGQGCTCFEGKADAKCFKLGIFPECSPDLKQKEIDRQKKWCPQHGYPVPCYKCGFNGTHI